jgi:hypothetical protein
MPMGGMAPPPYVDHFTSGFYVWELSFVALLLACFAAARTPRDLQLRERIAAGDLPLDAA